MPIIHEFHLRENHGMCEYERRDGFFLLKEGGDLRVGRLSGLQVKALEIHDSGRVDEVELKITGRDGEPDYERGAVVFRLRYRSEYHDSGYNAHRGGIMLSEDERDPSSRFTTYLVGVIELPLKPEDMPHQFGGIQIDRYRMRRLFRYQTPWPVLIVNQPDGKGLAVAEWEEGLKCFTPADYRRWLNPQEFPPALTDEQRAMAGWQGLIVE